MGRKYTANILSVGPSQWIEKGLMSQVGVSVLSGSSYSYGTAFSIHSNQFLHYIIRILFPRGSKVRTKNPTYHFHNIFSDNPFPSVGDPEASRMRMRLKYDNSLILQFFIFIFCFYLILILLNLFHLSIHSVHSAAVGLVIEAVKDWKTMSEQH